MYFRLKGAEIHIPPLRDRREDIPLLVNHAIGKYSAELNRTRPTITQPALMRLVAYDWPGNVREVFQLIHRMVVMTAADAIDVRDIPDEIRALDDASEGPAQTRAGLAGVGLDKLEKEAIRQTLAMTAGNRELTAQMLGIGERTLYRKLKEYGLR